MRKRCLDVRENNRGTASYSSGRKPVSNAKFSTPSPLLNIQRELWSKIKFEKFITRNFSRRILLITFCFLVSIFLLLSVLFYLITYIHINNKFVNTWNNPFFILKYLNTKLFSFMQSLFYQWLIWSHLPRRHNRKNKKIVKNSAASVRNFSFRLYAFYIRKKQSCCRTSFWSPIEPSLSGAWNTFARIAAP